MVLNLLREALSSRRRNIRISREISEGKDIAQISVTPVEEDVKLELEQRWWLEKAFDRLHLSICQGVLLIYGLIEIPHFVFLLFIIGRTSEYFAISYTSSFFGDMFIPISLLLIHSVYKKLVVLKNHMNEVSSAKKFVVPPILIRGMSSKGSSAQLDDEYRNRYIKPIMFKTLQNGLNLCFNRSYTLGSGAIAAGLFFLIMYLRFVLKVIPWSIFMLAEPGIPEIAFAYRVFSFCIMGFDWFIVGMLIWMLFITFLVILQASGNAVRIRPYESIKEFFAPATTLTLQNSFTATFLVAWLSPFVLVWSVLPPDPQVRQATVNFIQCMLLVAVPMIILSIILPMLKIHKGMEESRERALIIKLRQLERIDKMEESDPKKYFEFRKCLIEDYKDIQRNPKWVLNTAQTVEILGTILLPMITFLLSIVV